MTTPGVRSRTAIVVAPKLRGCLARPGRDQISIMLPCTIYERSGGTHTFNVMNARAREASACRRIFRALMPGDRAPVFKDRFRSQTAIVKYVSHCHDMAGEPAGRWTGRTFAPEPQPGPRAPAAGPWPKISLAASGRIRIFPGCKLQPGRIILMKNIYVYIIYNIFFPISVTESITSP